jgi:hypothetical protein
MRKREERRERDAFLPPVPSIGEWLAGFATKLTNSALTMGYPLI